MDARVAGHLRAGAAAVDAASAASSASSMALNDRKITRLQPTVSRGTVSRCDDLDEGATTPK